MIECGIANVKNLPIGISFCPFMVNLGIVFEIGFTTLDVKLQRQECNAHMTCINDGCSPKTENGDMD